MEKIYVDSSVWLVGWLVGWLFDYISILTTIIFTHWLILLFFSIDNTNMNYMLMGRKPKFQVPRVHNMIVLLAHNFALVSEISDFSLPHSYTYTCLTIYPHRIMRYAALYLCITPINPSGITWVNPYH